MQDEYERGHLRGLEVRREHALRRAEAMEEPLSIARAAIRKAGHRVTNQRIADSLTAAGVPTPTKKGKEWHPEMVRRILKIDEQHRKTSDVILKKEQEALDRLARERGRVYGADEATTPKMARQWEEARERHNRAYMMAREVALKLRGG